MPGQGREPGMSITSTSRSYTKIITCATALIATQAIALEQQWLRSFNSAGQPTLSDGPRLSADDSIRYTYDSNGNLSSISNSLGHTTTLAQYNGRGQPGLITDPNGIKVRMTYHLRGWLLSKTLIDPGGDQSQDVTTRYSYDNNGQPLTTYLADGSTLTFEYDAAQRLTAVANSLGERIEYELDQHGNRLRTTTLSTTGTITHQVDKEYDALGRLIELISNIDSSVLYRYDKNGNQIARDSGNGRDLLTDYDALNRAHRILTPLGTAVTYKYDTQGNLESIADPLQATTEYHNDGFNSLSEVVSPDTATTTHSYDAASNRLNSIDASGSITQYRYDPLNRLTAEENDDPGLDIHFEYDAGAYGKGRLTAIVDESGRTSMNYDDRGNLLQQDLDTGEMTLSLAYQYDAADRITEIRYPSGRSARYTRGASGKITTVASINTDGSSQLLASGIGYLPFGGHQSMQYGNGLNFESSHDSSRRITRISLDTMGDWHYQHDSAGNVTRIDRGTGVTGYEYDTLNRLVKASEDAGELAYSYDANGNRQGRWEGAVFDDYRYEEATNRLVQTSQWRYEYDSRGNQIAKITRLNATGDGLRYHYNARNRLIRVSERLTSNSGAVGEPVQLETELVSYVYNAKGQRAKRISDRHIIDYLYGPNGQMLAEVRSDGLVLREYFYLNGKPLAVAYTSEIVVEPESGPEQILDNDSTATFASGSWDSVRKKGAINDYYRRSKNMGNRYRWVPEALNNAAYEVYAWWPKRRKQNKSAGFTITHHGTQSFAILDQSRNSKQWVYLGTYAFTGDDSEFIELSDEGGDTAADAIRLVEILPAKIETRTDLHYFHNDHLGTPHRMTDQFGDTVWHADYRPFGRAIENISLIDNSLRFPGQFYDAATGLHYNHFRDYDPDIGRYLQPDPIGLAGGLNPYSYVANNPLAKVDPNGLCPWCVVGAGVGAGYEGLRQFHNGNLALTGASLGKIAVAGGAGALTGGFGSVVSQAGIKGLNAFLANAQFNISNGLSAEIIAAAIDKRTLNEQDIYAILLGALGSSAVGSDPGLDELTSLILAELAEDGITTMASEFEACPDL
jgi:RHS repeat-associated protein